MNTKTRNALAVVFSFLITGLGTSMAQARNDCPEGALAGGVYTDLVINGGGDCYIMNVLVTGDVTAKGMDQISMAGSTVNGTVSFSDSNSAFLYNNIVNGDAIISWANASSTVVRNTVNNGDMVINDRACRQQQSAIAEENSVYGGLLRVNCNEDATVRNNTVYNGDIICKNNDRLDTHDNHALGVDSQENCNKD